MGNIDQFEKVISQSSKVLFIGMGNNIKSEDGIGLFLLDLLKQKFTDSKYNYLVTYNVPINFLTKINDHNPDLIIFVDAMMTEELSTGKIIFVNSDSILPTNSLTTHYQDFDLLKKFINNKLKKKVLYYFLGITISNTEYGLLLPKQLKKIANELVLDIVKLFN